MKTTDYPGIDYGLGRTNIGADGIRFGVIPNPHVGAAWYDTAEPDYGNPTCPKCGGKISRNLRCPRCRKHWESEDVYGDTPVAFTLDDGEYKAQQGGDDCDIFVLSSPYFTYAQFCSPCAPGACYLLNSLETPDANNRAYCFGHDWFDSGVAPYPVYSVETGELVQPPKA